jgi:hypothetical protein
MQFLVTVLLIVLFVRWLMMRSKLKSMEQQIAALTYRVWTLENRTAPPPPPPPVASEVKIPAPIAERIPEPIAAPLPEPPPPPPPARPLAGIAGIGSSEEWEALIGGSILNKAGALILVVGIALFLGYSFGHLSPAGRASIAFAVSLALLGAGVLLERRGRYRMFSRGLTGAGWAALYATAYAIYALPEARIVQDPFIGSLGMLAVAGGMIAHALRYRSQAVTAVAYFAAFAALAATPNSPFAVVALIPLAASLLYLASRFEWYRLPVFGIAATYLTCISRGQSGASLGASQSLFLVYWLLFEAFDFIRVKRRIVADGFHLLWPINTVAFLGLSSLVWSKHRPDLMWLAAAYGAALFLIDTLLRAYLRPPSSFSEQDGLLERLQAGGFEASLVVSAALAGLAVTGRVPGVWSGAALAVEAEILYLAGIQLASPFIRALGYAAFACSVSETFANAGSKSGVLGHATSHFTPPALFHALLFYVNRALRKPNVVFSSAATVFIAIVCAIEFPSAWIGTTWALFGAVLFELGNRKKIPEFLFQSYALLFAGAVAAFAVNLWTPDSPVLPLAITLAVSYAAALRNIPALQIGSTAAAGLLAVLLIYRLAPHDRLGLAWIALAILFLLHEHVLALKEFRVAGIGVAALAFLATLSDNIDPPQLLLSLLVVAGLYACQFLMRLSGWKPEQTAFSIAASLLLAIILFGRVSGGLLTVAWGVEGLALLAAGFPLGQRILRLQGLVLLLVCILKLFLFDLRNLETLYRILSFVVLGIILLGVSWIYTRFQDQIKKLL